MSSSKRHRLGVALLLLSIFIAHLSGCSSKTPEELMEQAMQYHQQGKFWDCIALCEELIKNAPAGDPVLGNAQMLLADCYRQIGDLARARTHWNEIINEHGVNNQLGHNSFSNLIYSLLYEARMSPDPNNPDHLEQEAERALLLIAEKAEELEPDDPWRHQLSLIKVRVQWELEHFDEAVATYATLIEDESTTTSFKHLVLQEATTMLSRQEDYAKAIELNEKYLEHFIDTPFLVAVLHILSQLHQEVGNAEKALEYQELAIAEFDKLIEKTPGAQPKVQYMLQKAQAYDQLDQYDKACDVFREALELYPSSAEAMGFELLIPTTFVRKGNHLALKGEGDDAIVAYDEALRLYNELSRGSNPEVAQAVFNYIASVQQLKRNLLTELEQQNDTTTTTLETQPSTDTLQLTTTTLETQPSTDTLQLTTTTLETKPTTTTIIDKTASPELFSR